MSVSLLYVNTGQPHYHTISESMETDRVISETTVADLEGAQGVCSNSSLEPNYFIFMGKFMKNQIKWGKRTPLVTSIPPSTNPGSIPELCL